MSLVVYGLSYQVAPLAILERVAIGPHRMPKALARLSECPHVSEGVILSTCNRVEVYVKASRFHAAVAEIRDFFCEFHHIEPAYFADRVYSYHEEAAAEHLFAVASGLESMVLGEGEILGQVREAWRAAEAEGTAGRSLSALFRSAIEAAKRVRTETAVSSTAASVSSAAVALAEAELGSLAGRAVVVLGAGEAGQAAARALVSGGVGSVVVANRRAERAREVAERVGGRAVTMNELDGAVEAADIVIASTSSPDLVLDVGRIEQMATDRAGRPLLLIDIAVPRDIDPSAASVEGVTLLDMDALRKFVDAGMARRAEEAGRGRAIVAEEVERYLADEAASRYGTLIAELRSSAEAIRRGELERHSAKLAALSDDERAAVEAVTASLVNKLLHSPTVKVREAATSPEGEVLADALVTLFGLSEPPSATT